MSTQAISEDEHKLLMLKREQKRSAGRKGGLASKVARAERKAAYAELEQALEANAHLPGAKALIRSTLAAYGLILRMQNPAGPRQPDIRGVSALLSGFTANLERLGMLPESTSRPPSATESGAQADAARTTPTGPRAPLYCGCESGNPIPCELCKARSAARAAKAAEGARP